MAAGRMTEREKLQTRLEAAKINGGAAVVTPRGDDRYTVEGRTGTRYTVVAHSIGEMRCDCKAGIHGGHCWHQAAVYLRVIADSTLVAA